MPVVKFPRYEYEPKPGTNPLRARAIQAALGVMQDPTMAPDIGVGPLVGMARASKGGKMLIGGETAQTARIARWGRSSAAKKMVGKPYYAKELGEEKIVKNIFIEPGSDIRWIQFDDDTLWKTNTIDLNERLSTTEGATSLREKRINPTYRGKEMTHLEVARRRRDRMFKRFSTGTLNEFWTRPMVRRELKRRQKLIVKNKLDAEPYVVVESVGRYGLLDRESAEWLRGAGEARIIEGRGRGK